MPKKSEGIGGRERRSGLCHRIAGRLWTTFSSYFDPGCEALLIIPFNISLVTPHSQEPSATANPTFPNLTIGRSDRHVIDFLGSGSSPPECPSEPTTLTRQKFVSICLRPLLQYRLGSGKVKYEHRNGKRCKSEKAKDGQQLFHRFASNRVS